MHFLPYLLNICRKVEAKAWAITSFKAWWLADLPGARLQTKLRRPCVSTREPQRHWCGTQRGRPSLNPTPILTASSSSLKPQEAIDKAKAETMQPKMKQTEMWAQTRLNHCFVQHDTWAIPEWLFLRKHFWQSTILWRPLRLICL